MRKMPYRNVLTVDRFQKVRNVEGAIVIVILQRFLVCDLECRLIVFADALKFVTASSSRAISDRPSGIMAGRVVSRCVSRTLLSARPANGVMSGGVSRCFSTSVRRTAAALTVNKMLLVSVRSVGSQWPAGV